VLGELAIVLGFTSRPRETDLPIRTWAAAVVHEVTGEVASA
jgi:hypothetical protein